ncbi:type I toxin-antitoxin system Fst family toxin [Staphylococcus warneri]
MSHLFPSTTIISGFIVAIFTHWLRNRNNKKDDR